MKKFLKIKKRKIFIFWLLIFNQFLFSANAFKYEKIGILEIKAIKCGVTKTNNKSSEVAYLQIKDLSNYEKNKIFIFNGWTFSSNPSITPIDHPIYDIWLAGCENIQ